MLQEMKAEISALNQGQADMKTEIASLKQDQANMKTEMHERFDHLESELKYAWQDIGITEQRIQQHEKEFHSA